MPPKKNTAEATPVPEDEDVSMEGTRAPKDREDQMENGQDIYNPATIKDTDQRIKFVRTHGHRAMKG